MLEEGDTLVECILASLLLSNSDITLFKKSMFIKLNRNICLEVQVKGNKFILGNQIVELQQNHLGGCATAVHLA